MHSLDVDTDGDAEGDGAYGSLGNAHVVSLVNKRRRFNKDMNDQTLWETTWTLQYKPVPNLITRAGIPLRQVRQKYVSMDGDGVSRQPINVGRGNDLPLLGKF